LKTHKPEVIKLLRQPEEAMTAIILNARDRIIEVHKGRQYRASDEIRAAEREIERIQHDVMNGQAQLDDFQKAVNAWERVCNEGLKKGEV
jgi:hypothetical protein